MKTSPSLWPALGVGTAVLAVVSAYLILRFAPSPVMFTVGVLVIVLGALAVLGFLGTRRGHAATFVAIALVLPYALMGVVTYASAQRASAEFDSIFDDDDFDDADLDDLFDDDDDPFDDDTSDDDTEGDGTYGSDPYLDALQDGCVGGDQAACKDLYFESPPDSEYESTAEEYGTSS